MGLINPLDQVGGEELRNPAGEGVTDYFAASGNGREFTYNGSKGRINTIGSFGGGTLTLQTSVNKVAWFTDPDFSLTVEDPKNIAVEIPRALNYRFVLTGATTPTLSIFFTQGQGF